MTYKLCPVCDEIHKEGQPKCVLTIPAPMSIHDIRPCPCGSGKDSEWQLDGRGIALTRTCDDCHDEKMKRYNPVILRHYTQENVDEQIEEDY